MRNFFGRKFLFAVLCLIPVVAFAGDVRPGFLSKWINAEAPAGHATFRKLLIKVYDANLWSDSDEWSYDVTFALSLTYNVSIDSSDFVDRTIDEMVRETGMSKENFDAYRQPLAKVFPDVKSGDTITALYVPKKPVRFFLNGEKTGEIDDPKFAKRFFDIWFSPKTSEPAFRQALLGSAE